MSKRRRVNDKCVVTDEELADFLDENHILYKEIQLCCFLRKVPSIDYIHIENGKQLCLAIFQHIKNIIHKFYSYPFFNGRSDGDEYRLYIENNDHKIISWVKDDCDDSSEFFKLSLGSFNNYFEVISEQLTTKISGYNVKIRVNPDSDYAFEISIKKV